ncbi:hypothetical protein HNO83_12760 [Leifsonia sp. C5G2]|nr:hypothetical protein [Leifsonia sp. C5G2]
MGKAPLRQLDVRDAGGVAIPVLGASSNGLLAASALLNLLILAVGVDAAELAWPRVWKVATGGESEALAEAETICEEFNLDLFATQQFRDLASNFILTALLPASAAGVRTVIKYAYHWDVDPMPAAPLPLGRRVQVWLKSTAAGLGLASLSVDVDLNSADSSSSYHLECTAPNGISCSEVRLPTDSSGSEPVDPASGPVGHVKGRFDFGHRGDDEPARVSFVMEPGGALSRAALFSALTAAFLFFLILVPGVPGAFSKDPGSALSLLLFLPAVLLALNAKGTENVFVSRFLRPSRIISAALSAVYAVSGGLLVAKASEEAVVAWWRFGLFCAVIALILTAGGLYGLRVRRRV